MSILSATLIGRMVVPVAAVAAAGMALLVSINLPVHQESSPTDAKLSDKAPATTSAGSEQASVAPPQRQTALATAQQQVDDLAALLPAPPTQSAAGEVTPE